jgi:hypothetical protein
VHADDTPLPVLDPGRGRTRPGYLWTYGATRVATRSKEVKLHWRCKTATLIVSVPTWNSSNANWVFSHP